MLNPGSLFVCLVPCGVYVNSLAANFGVGSADGVGSGVGFAICCLIFSSSSAAFPLLPVLIKFC